MRGRRYMGSRVDDHRLTWLSCIVKTDPAVKRLNTALVNLCTSSFGQHHISFLHAPTCSYIRVLLAQIFIHAAALMKPETYITVAARHCRSFQIQLSVSSSWILLQVLWLSSINRSSCLVFLLGRCCLIRLIHFEVLVRIKCNFLDVHGIGVLGASASGTHYQCDAESMCFLWILWVVCFWFAQIHFSRQMSVSDNQFS